MSEFIASTLRSATPLSYAALGVLASLRAGVFHLGIEGLMLTSAFTAAVVAAWTGSVALAVVVAVTVSCVVSTIYWALVVWLGADPVIAGLGLTTASLGLTSFLLRVWFDGLGRLDLDVGLPRPISGTSGGPLAVFNEVSLLGWFVPVFGLLVWLLLRRSQFGLSVTAVGSYEYGAAAAGVDASRTRLAALLMTGVGCALAGAELSLGGLTAFSEGMTNGRGFIAFAAALFGQLSPVGTFGTAVFFGAADAVGVQSQLNGFDFLPRPLILAIPFVLTIGAISVSSRAQKVRQSVR